VTPHHPETALEAPLQTHTTLLFSPFSLSTIPHFLKHPIRTESRGNAGQWTLCPFWTGAHATYALRFEKLSQTSDGPSTPMSHYWKTGKAGKFIWASSAARDFDLPGAVSRVRTGKVCGAGELVPAPPKPLTPASSNARVPPYREHLHTCSAIIPFGDGGISLHAGIGLAVAGWEMPMGPVGPIICIDFPFQFNGKFRLNLLAPLYADGRSDKSIACMHTQKLDLNSFSSCVVFQQKTLATAGIPQKKTLSRE
jgi:hypothetical protein